MSTEICLLTVEQHRLQHRTYCGVVSNIQSMVTTTLCPHTYSASAKTGRTSVVRRESGGLIAAPCSHLAVRLYGRCTVAELCVNATTGDIYAARDDGFEWGVEEYLPTFLVVRVECDADAAQQYVGQRLDVSAAVTADVLTMVENSQWAVPTVDAAHITPVEGA